MRRTDQTPQRRRDGRSASSSPSRNSVLTSEPTPLTPSALRLWAAAEGVSRVRTERVLRGFYGGDFSGFAALDRVTPALRARLADRFTASCLPDPLLHESNDGTRKLVFRWSDGSAIETVLIPDPPRQTVCVSSQVGCGMGCDFCATATLGFRRNLTAAEILGQLQAARSLLPASARITNVVFMGMGEPLRNYAAVIEAIEAMRADWGFGLSGRRITVSTVGLLPQLARLADETNVAIAVSLSATTDALRDRLMPVNRRYPLAEVVETCRRMRLAQRRRIVFEYVLLQGVNDDVTAAAELVELLRGVPAKVNLIPFNPFQGSHYRRPTMAGVFAFQEYLLAAGVSAMVRRTRGDEVRAACGQLAAGHV